jgi:hypothetical protein
MHLKSFGWEPIILTVHEDYYEETLDWHLNRLLPSDLRIEKVSAFAITKPRLIGDIGLRAFFQLRREALKLLRSEHFDFIYIPIPSFYVALLGPYLKRKTGIKYGIDYIDPWVHIFPGTDKFLSRHWFSSQLARWLEPRAVSGASLLTGVAEGYYKQVIVRNPQLRNHCVFGSMPYGGEIKDHEQVVKMNLSPYLFKKNGKIQLIYAGAMLPTAYGPLEAVFNVIQKHQYLFYDVEFHFIGTGSHPNKSDSYTIKQLAVKYGLWNTIVFEYPKRIPYLDVLVHLKSADGVWILGGTESHYTPSKVYQGILSRKPLLALLHKESTALKVVELTNTGVTLSFCESNYDEVILEKFPIIFAEWKKKLMTDDFMPLNTSLFDEFSALSVTKVLAGLLNAAIEK